MKKIFYQPLSNERYQNPVTYKIEEQVVPQGLAYFTAAGKKHFPQQQRGELESYQGMQHLFDPPKRLINDYDRSLCTKDIDGAVTNTLKSKVVKNMELAQAYKQEKQKSLWESNKGPSEPEYQPRKRWEDFDPYKNRSAIYTQNEEYKESDKPVSLNNTDKKDRLSEIENRQQIYEQQIQTQQAKIPYSEQPHQQFQQQQQYQQVLQQQQQQQIQPQLSQPISSQQYYQQLQTSSSQPHLQMPSQVQEQPRYLDDDRSRQEQLLMQKQWEMQKQENAQRHLQYQNEKLLEQKSVKQQQEIDQQLIDQQKKQEINQKQQYARDLRMQQESNRDGVSRKGFTPPPVSKSEIINQLLQQPQKLQKSQGFDEQQQLPQIQHYSPQQAQKDSLSKEMEQFDKKMVINRFRPHELQQYIYDMRNGRIGGSKTRNNPTYMSYAGQQLVNQ